MMEEDLRLFTAMDFSPQLLTCVNSCGIVYPYKGVDGMIKVEDILAANRYGLENPAAFLGYRTPVLACAQYWGQEGIDLSRAQVVQGWRYGNSETGISYNYADDKSEHGLSLAALEGEDEIGSSIWFCDRPKIHFSGILLPSRGSDGEPLILPVGGENYDA